MKLQSQKQVTVRDTVIGGPNFPVCLPLVAKKMSALLNQADALVPLDPDLIEWRIDGYDNVEDINDSLQALDELRRKIKNIPLIFTCRIDAEGGFKKIAQNTRWKLIKAAIQSGHLDIVDIEMCNESADIEDIQKTARQYGARLILSYHNFHNTPDKDFICEKLIQAQEMGADIAKVAVMPTEQKDVLTLLGATLKARTTAVRIPMVTIAMGSIGAVTRLTGGLFGSDMTFAVGESESAPGQIPIVDLRRAMTVLYEN